MPGNVTVDIFNFNDFHGALDNNVSDSDPGAARFAAVTRHLMRNSEHSILLAGGDNYIGQPISDIFYGRPTSRIFRELGVSYSVVGNHEWDWGFDKFEEFVYYGHLHFLAANIFYENTNTRPDIFHPYVIINRAGRRIAIVGFTLVSTPRVVVASAIEGFEFRDVEPWLGEMVNRLRDYYGAEAVLALTHENNTRILGDLADLGFDAIFSAHSHTIMNENIRGVPVIRTSHNGRSLARVSLDFDDDGLVGVRTNVYQNFVDGTHLPVGTVDQAVASIVRHYDALTAPHLNQILGIFGSGISAGRHGWANQIVFDYVTRNRPDWADVVLIQNNGGWRDIGHQDPASFLMVRHVWTLMPFINEIYLFRLRGENLIHLLNGRNAINTQNAAGMGFVNARRVGDDWIIVSTGQTITATGLYQVSMNDFMFTGGDNFGVEDLVDYPYPIVLGTTLRDAILRQVVYDPPQIVPVTGVLAAWDFSGNSAVQSALVQPELTAARPSSGYQQDEARLQFLTATGGILTPRMLNGMSMGVHVRNIAGTTEPSSDLHGLAGNAWWQTVVSTLGYEDIEVTWRMRSTNTAPRDWRLQYRAGSYGDWRNVGGAIALPSGNPTLAASLSHYRFLPETAEEQERLYLRWLMTSNVSTNGGTVVSGGTHQINNIVIRADAEPFQNEYDCDHCNDEGCAECEPYVPAPPAPISISAANQIQRAPFATAEVATVEGFVVGRTMNGAGTDFDNANLLVQDGTGPRDGILVWLSGANLSAFVGEWVRVTGYVTPAGGAASPRNQIQLGGIRGAIEIIDAPVNAPTFDPQAVELEDIVAPNNDYWFMPISLGPVQFGHNDDRTSFLTAPANTAAAPGRSHFVILDNGQRLELRPSVTMGATLDAFETGDYIIITRAYVSWQNLRTTVQLLHAEVERY